MTRPKSMQTLSIAGWNYRSVHDVTKQDSLPIPELELRRHIRCLLEFNVVGICAIRKPADRDTTANNSSPIEIENKLRRFVSLGWIVTGDGKIWARKATWSSFHLPRIISKAEVVCRRDDHWCPITRCWVHE